MGDVDQAEQDLKAIEDFVVNNADLERLEALLDRFNIFEAVGMELQEIRHSRFLAFLLDPNESHGMGDAFVKRLLQRAVMDFPNTSAPVTPIELSLWDLGQMEVRREWNHMDIFLLDERNRLAVIIENKIGAGEHGDQLERYYEAVREQFPDYGFLALYLTPDGDEPSHPEYLPVDYRAVCEILDDLAESRASVTEPDLRVLITHYTGMLRRHIVGDSEIERLSRQIYQKHQRAIDLIIEHRSNLHIETRNLLVSLTQDAEHLTYKGGRNPYIVFRPQEWEDVAAFNAGKDSVGFFRFVFHNNVRNSNELVLFLESSPGDEGVRQRLFEIGQENETVFNYLEDPATGHYPKLYRRSFLTPSSYQKAMGSEREAEIRKQWSDFLENDLPRIDAALKQERWIWESNDEAIEDDPGRGERFG